MTSNYFKILGIPSNASLAEIKSAYRKKAKLLHPDHNDSPDAHDQFLALSEAYDFLVGYRSGVYDRSSHKGKNYSPHNREKEAAKQRAESRARAQEHARMKFDAYKKTEHYRDSVALEVATRFATLLVTIGLLIILPIVAWLSMESAGRIVSVIIIALSMPVWLDVVRRPSIYLDTTDLFEALSRVVQFEGFQTVTSLLINGILFFGVCFSTLIPLKDQVLILCLASLIGFIISLLERYRRFRPALSLGLLPFLFTGTVLINYLASQHPVKEEYPFELKRHSIEDGRFEEDMLITLKDNAYEDYAGIRFFLRAKQFRKHRSIIYTFEEGLFGWKVMCDYELSP